MATTETAKTKTATETKTGRDYIRTAKAEGTRLYEDGAVEVLGGTAALVSDGTLLYFADATGCGCSTADERGGHACKHQWAGRYALDASGADQETAA